MFRWYAFAVVLIACLCVDNWARADGNQTDQTTDGSLSPAKLAFADSFDRKELGSYPAGNVAPQARAKLNWCVRRGKWEIRSDDSGNGYLFGAGAPGDIIIDRPVSGNFRLEYTTWSSNPGDRSAFLCIPQPNFDFKDVYLFLFGANYSKQNALLRGSTYLAAPITTSLPIPGKKHRVTIQKTDALLQMWVDGAVILSAKDRDYGTIQSELTGAQGVCIGLYTWSDGVCYDDLRILNLPQVRRETLPADAKTDYTLWRGFEDDAVGKVPGNASVHCGGSGSVIVRNEPTVVYYPKPRGQELVDDHCVELKSSGRTSRASMTFPTQAMQSGEVEAELLARSFVGECGSVSLIDGEGGELASVVISKDGTFNARTPKGLKRLRDRISYQNRPPEGRFYFQPGRWFTLRISFNAEAGVYHVSVVNLYAGFATAGISYFSLGTDLPMLGSAQVCGIRVATGDTADLLVDNVCVASPRAQKINGQPSNMPLRTILGLSHPWRKDPFSLSVYSLRNEPHTKYADEERQNVFEREMTDVFKRACVRYDQLLVRQALLDEHALRIARMAYHLGSTPAQVKAFVESVGKFRSDLETLYRCIGNAYRDAVNERILEEKFFPTADRLAKGLAAFEVEAESVSRLLTAATGKKLEPAPTLAPGPDEAPLEWKNRRFERVGKPTFFYPPYGVCALDLVEREHQEKLLQLDNCFSIPFILDEPNRQGSSNKKDSFTWDILNPFIDNYLLKDNAPGAFYVQSFLGCVHVMQECPAGWLETHRDNPDIFFCDRNGKNPNWEGTDKPYLARPLSGGRYAGGGGYWSRLNFWNEDVRKMYRDTLDEWSKYMSSRYPGRARFFALGLEQTNFPYTESGYNASAIGAFRNYLRKKHGSLETLNKAWGTQYGSFDEIDPRQYSAKKPNGLMYDFQVFRQEGYFEWMQLIRQSLQKNIPDLVTMNDFNWAFGGMDHERGLDLVRMFQTYDAVGCHFYGIEAVQPMYRYMDSLRKAYGNSLGNFEWAAGLHLPDLFNEDAYKSCGLLDTWEEMAWGKSILSIWYGGSAGFSEGGQFFSPTLRNGLLRYSTGYLPIARMRSRRFGEIALTCPTVTPKLAILDPITSQWNGIDVHTPMLRISTMLEKARWNYGFIHEEALLEGKQSLQGLQTLVIPRGICLRPEVSDLLLRWIQQGGTLIAVLPPGAMNQYGQPDGHLVKEILGDVSLAFNDTFTEWKYKDAGGLKGAVQVRDDGNLLDETCGKGRLFVFVSSNPLPETSLLKLVADHTQRDTATKNGSFRAVLRVSQNHYYVFIVNPDCYESKEDTIVVTGKYGNAVDLGCDAAFPVKTTHAHGATAFRLRLAPGEGTVIRLGKQ